MELLGLQANDKGRDFVSRGLKIKTNFRAASGEGCALRAHPGDVGSGKEELLWQLSYL